MNGTCFFSYDAFLPLIFWLCSTLAQVLRYYTTQARTLTRHVLQHPTHLFTAACGTTDAVGLDSREVVNAFDCASLSLNPYQYPCLSVSPRSYVPFFVLSSVYSFKSLTYNNNRLHRVLFQVVFRTSPYAVYVFLSSLCLSPLLLRFVLTQPN